MSETQTDPPATLDDRYAWEEDDHDELPVRPRRRGLTPAAGVLALVAVGAAGFVGGVQVQKHQGGSSGGGTGAGGGARAGLPGGFTPPAGARTGAGRGVAGGAGTGAAAGGGLTAGTVSSKDGDVLYVKSADGTTVKVRTTASSKLTRNAAASVKGIYPGDTVLVTGTTAANGTVKATRVTATAASAASAGGGFGGFGGFGGAAGGATGAAGGATGAAGGATGATGAGGAAAGGPPAGGGPVLLPPPGG